MCIEKKDHNHEGGGGGGERGEWTIPSLLPAFAVTDFATMMMMTTIRC